MSLFFDQPEIFSTINIILGVEFKNIPILLIFGGLFVFFSLLFFIIKKKGIAQSSNFKNIILVIMLIFWIPLYINFFYNNVYDFIENLEVYNYNISKKRIVRICNMDHRQNLGGIWCQLFSYFTFSKNNTPEKSKVKLLIPAAMKPYFYYYLYPYFNFTHDIAEAEYLLFYFSSDFYYKDGKLYKKIADKNGKLIKELEVGEYFIERNMGPQRLILKSKK